MLEKIFSLFSREPSADEKALTIADLLGMLLDFVLGYMDIEVKAE